MEFAHYRPRKIQSLKLVKGNPDYSLKYADRSSLSALEAKKDNCDGVIIVRKGELTDTSFSNIAFLKKNIWFTPVHPLLAGTARAALIESGRLQEIVITPADISGYEGYRLINAMLPFDEQPVLHVETIKY
jgi:4-amino-4-deoxychorismate lyase